LIGFIFEAISPFKLVEREFITSGLPTGNGLSPVLSNLHLHRFDLAMEGFNYFRFVDDIVVLADRRETVQEARDRIGLLLSALGLRLNEKPEKTRICDLHRQSVVFLGYEIRGGNLYPSEKSILRLERRLRVWGQRALSNPMMADISKASIMKGFVRKFRSGPVRKLFRVLDRTLRQHYPPGVTLTGMLDGRTRNVNGTHGDRGLHASDHAERSAKGQGRSSVTKKALNGRVPVVTAVEEQQFNVAYCSSAPEAE
jgi:hypothetical protein